MFKCHFCDRTVAIDDACDDGWQPGFFDGNEPHGDFVCPECAAVKLRVGEDGEMELIDNPGQPGAEATCGNL